MRKSVVCVVCALMIIFSSVMVSQAQTAPGNGTSNSGRPGSIATGKPAQNQQSLPGAIPESGNFPGIVVFDETCAGNDGYIKLMIPFGEAWTYAIKNHLGNVLTSGTNAVGTALASHLSGGNYTIDLSDKFGNHHSVGVNLIGMDPVSVQINGPSTGIVNETIDFEADVNGGSQLRWDFSDGSIIFDNQTVSKIFTAPGIYTFSATTRNLTCSATETKTIEIFPGGRRNDGLMGTTGNPMDSVQRVSPPNVQVDNNNITLKATVHERNLTIVNMEVFTLLGRPVSSLGAPQISADGKQGTFDISRLDPGTYGLLVTLSNGQIHAQKFIKM